MSLLQSFDPFFSTTCPHWGSQFTGCTWQQYYLYLRIPTFLSLKIKTNKSELEYKKNKSNIHFSDFKRPFDDNRSHFAT